MQGVAAAELAFQNTLWYTKERGSMRALSGTKAPELKADPIIHHPSVRTMLLTQKAVAEGGRSMVYECAKLVDKMDLCEAAGDAKGAKAIDERLAFLTPILKGFLTEVGKEAADLGIQAYGGHGYIKDNKAEQVFRDVRIAALWEGTTQIQVGEASTAFHGRPRCFVFVSHRLPTLLLLLLLLHGRRSICSAARSCCRSSSPSESTARSFVRSACRICSRPTRRCVGTRGR